jgi:tRNA U34 5-carboxymethylaminomethyl modifying enzyme MnmG/GidA
VIAQLHLSKDVEMDQLQEQLDVEIMKLQHVKEDVHQLNHQDLHQVHVIAKHNQYLNVEMDQLQELLHVEIMKLHLVI